MRRMIIMLLMMLCIFLSGCEEKPKDARRDSDAKPTNTIDREDLLEILAQKTYNIGEDTFDFSFGQRENGEYSFMLLCHVEDKTDAYMTHISLNALFNSDEEPVKVLTETMNFSYSIIIGDGTLLLRAKDILYLANDKEIVDVNDYFSVDWFLESNAVESDYGDRVIGFLVDFIENE